MAVEPEILSNRSISQSVLVPKNSTAPELPYFVLSHQIENEHTLNRYGHDSCQYKLLSFIHSHKVQFSLLLLLGIEILGLFTTVFLNLEYPSCRIIERECVAFNATSLEEDGSCVAGCHPNELVEEVIYVIELASFVILSLFELELVLLCGILGPVFFRNWAYLFDFVIVTSSLVIQALFVGGSEEALAEALIFTRVWRFVRIGHGIFSQTQELENHTIETLEEQIELLQERVKTKKRLSQSSMKGEE